MPKFEAEARPGGSEENRFLSADIIVSTRGLNQQAIQRLQNLCNDCPLNGNSCTGFDDGEFDGTSIGALVRPVTPLNFQEMRTLLRPANCSPTMLKSRWEDE